MKVTAAQLVAKVRWRFDLERQTTRHSDASLIDNLNDCIRGIRRELFAAGSLRNVVTVIADSSAADDTVDLYPGQRVDGFGYVDDEPSMLAERIHCVEYLGTSCTTKLEEIGYAQAQEMYGSSSNTGDPLAWFPVGPVAVDEEETVGVCVTPRLSSPGRFRIAYLPQMRAITLPATGVDDVGIDDLSIPLEWLLCSMGIRVGVRDDDAQLVNLRASQLEAERTKALSDTKLTSTSESYRGRVYGGTVSRRS